MYTYSFAASELKNFLLYYLQVTLYDVLPARFYVHACILSKAIRLLLSENLSDKDLSTADKLLKRYCKLHEEYYGMYMS